MRPLYQIDQDIDNFEFEVNEDGEILNMDAYDSIQMERTAKVEGTILKRKNIAARADSTRQEIANLKALLAQDEKQIEGLDDWVKKALDGEKFRTDKCSVTYRKSTSVAVKDEDSVLQYLRASGHTGWIKTTETFSKTDIKKLLQQHVDVPGAELVESQNMTIK